MERTQTKETHYNEVIMPIRTTVGTEFTMEDYSIFNEKLWQSIAEAYPDLDELSLSTMELDEMLTQKFVDVYEYFGNYVCTVVFTTG